MTAVAVAAIVAGAALIVGGIAIVHVPAAMITAGLILLRVGWTAATVRPVVRSDHAGG